MSSPSSASSPTKNTKWVTHLALSADIILGKAKSENCVHEVECTMDDSVGQIHTVMLNCWARDVPEQGVYLICNIPFATHPLRLGVPDVSAMRAVPDELDGGDAGSTTLPPASIVLTGTGVISSVSPDRKAAVIKGFTYLNKTHQWQPWTINAAFPDSPKYNIWTTPGPRNLVNFDCSVVREAGHFTFDTALTRITLLEAAPTPLLQALGVVSPATDDRAERIRQARAARQVQGNGKAKISTEDSSTPAPSEHAPEMHAGHPPAPVARPVTPTPSQRHGKRGRHE